MKNCAIYTRVSTSMQAEVEYNSCEAQKDRIVSFIKSQEDMQAFQEYSDPGFTGGNVNGLKGHLACPLRGQQLPRAACRDRGVAAWLIISLQNT